MTDRILYILTPGSNVSPFDVTLAADSGFTKILPFTNIDKQQVVPMVQDAIFARPPGRFNDTGIFIGGRDVHLAKDMLDRAKSAMVGPFEVGVFADPNGAYSTSASVVALVEKALHEQTSNGLDGRSVNVFGPGPVGLCIAVLCAQQGAKVNLCQLTGDDEERVAKRFCERYQVNVGWKSALTSKQKIEAVREPDVIVCCAKAGVRILDDEDLSHAENLLVAADTNAVPPSGIDELPADNNGTLSSNSGIDYWGIGSLAIGNIKYKTQYGLFQKMQNSDKAAVIDFPDAYEYALELVNDMTKKDMAA